MALPIIGDILETIGSLAGKFIKDKDAVEAFKHEVNMSLTKMDLAQIEINKVEAAHLSVWVSGWRPFIGWVAGLALALEFLVRPIVQWGLDISGQAIQLPKSPIKIGYNSWLSMFGN